WPPLPSTPFPYTTLFRSHVFMDGEVLQQCNVPALVTRTENAPPSSVSRPELPCGHVGKGADIEPLRERVGTCIRITDLVRAQRRSEEHTSELQSLAYLVC